MEFRTARAEQQYGDLARAGADLVVCLDFDGTLAPIVEDPAQAHIHPDAPAVLERLAGRVLAIAVVTGRPARQVLALGGLEEVGTAVGEAGRRLFVLGQYGHERWTSEERRIVSPKPPAGLAGLLAELPALLRRAGAAEAFVEEKGLAVAVHTRRLAEPQEAFARLLPLLTERARAHDLAIEPGRMVIELRASGMDKGQAVRRLVDELGARAVTFLGDDLGDVEAFEALDVLARDGLATLKVCSASQEESKLAELADVVVPGPEGVLDFLRDLAAAT
jgi:trehalose 6-phosphate phosphatase